MSDNLTRLIALADAMQAVAPQGTISSRAAVCRDAAEELRNKRARLAEAEAALKAVMSAADAAKEPCGMDPESPAAIRNGVFASIAQLAAQGLGLVRGPRLADSAPADCKDAPRLSVTTGSADEVLHQCSCGHAWMAPQLPDKPCPVCNTETDNG